MNWFVKLLIKYVPHKEIGWKEIGEVFYRFQLLKTPWLNIYLHRLDAKQWHPQCHNHPWAFWAILLWGGYYEYTEEDGIVWRSPGSVLYRPEWWTHNVITPTVSWSVIITSGRRQEWGFKECGFTPPQPLSGNLQPSSVDNLY